MFYYTRGVEVINGLTHTLVERCSSTSEAMALCSQLNKDAS